MGRDVVRYSIGIPRKTYEEIQEMADEKGIPKSRVINIILIAYFKFKRERERNDK